MNDLQYFNTKAQLAKFQAAMALLESNGCPPTVDPKLHKAEMAATRSIVQDLQDEVDEFENGKPIRVAIQCSNGHKQEMKIARRMGMEWAEGMAGLLDGTSPMYQHSPIGTDSVIGKCGICQAQLKATVLPEA
jgi:hypothetical protein